MKLYILCDDLEKNGKLSYSHDYTDVYSEKDLIEAIKNCDVDIDDTFLEVEVLGGVSVNFNPQINQFKLK